MLFLSKTENLIISFSESFVFFPPRSRPRLKPARLGFRILNHGNSLSFHRKTQHRKKSWSKFEWKHINNGVVLTHNARSRINLEFYSGIERSLNGAGACGGSRWVLIRMQNATGMTMVQFWQLNCGKKFKGEEDFSERFSPRSRHRFEFL